MRILVIPDSHLKAGMFKRATEIMHEGLADNAVCLMDIADDWGCQNKIDIYEEAYDAAIAFAKEFPDSIWCYGNHDLSYQWHLPQSGFSVWADYAVQKKLIQLKSALSENNHIKFVQRIDNVLFSHAGLCSEFVWRYADPAMDIDEVIDRINALSPRAIWDDISPVWLRPSMQCQMYKTDSFIQAVGHTPVSNIFCDKGVIYTDVFSSDPRAMKPIGSCRFIIIDTLNCSYVTVK